MYIENGRSSHHGIVVLQCVPVLRRTGMRVFCGKCFLLKWTQLRGRSFDGLGQIEDGNTPWLARLRSHSPRILVALITVEHRDTEYTKKPAIIPRIQTCPRSLLGEILSRLLSNSPPVYNMGIVANKSMNRCTHSYATLSFLRINEQVSGCIGQKRYT